MISQFIYHNILRSMHILWETEKELFSFVSKCCTEERSHYFQNRFTFESYQIIKIDFLFTSFRLKYVNFIAYVVHPNMGYDLTYVEFVSFSDSKHSKFCCATVREHLESCNRIARQCGNPRCKNTWRTPGLTAIVLCIDSYRAVHQQLSSCASTVIVVCLDSYRAVHWQLSCYASTVIVLCIDSYRAVHRQLLWCALTAIAICIDSYRDMHWQLSYCASTAIVLCIDSYRAVHWQLSCCASTAIVLCIFAQENAEFLKINTPRYL